VPTDDEIARELDEFLTPWADPDQGDWDAIAEAPAAVEDINRMLGGGAGWPPKSSRSRRSPGTR